MSDVRYVQRDGEGIVVGHYANPQPGIATEAIAADDPEIAGLEQRLDEARTTSARQAFRILSEMVGEESREETDAA